MHEVAVVVVEDQAITHIEVEHIGASRRSVVQRDGEGVRG